MKEPLIDFETAKLAKEKGFNIDTSSQRFYTLKRETTNYPGISQVGSLRYTYDYWNPCFKQDNNYAYAPTQSVLQKWLRVEHNIQIEIFPNSLIVPQYGWRVLRNPDIIITEDLCVHEYEEALEQALVTALNLIK